MAHAAFGLRLRLLFERRHNNDFLWNKLLFRKIFSIESPRGDPPYFLRLKAYESQMGDFTLFSANTILFGCCWFWRRLTFKTNILQDENDLLRSVPNDRRGAQCGQTLPQKSQALACLPFFRTVRTAPLQPPQPTEKTSSMFYGQLCL